MEPFHLGARWFVVIALATTACGSGSPEPKALCRAVESGNVDEVRGLLQTGNIDLNADQGYTGARCRPFPEAMEKVLPESMNGAGPRLEIVRSMLDARADPSSCWMQPSGRNRSRDGASICVIHYAARSQSTAFVRLAIERGANVKGGGGAAALSAAAGQGNLEAVKLLVEAGAPLNEVSRSADDPGRSDEPALGAAVRGYHDPVVAYLESQPGAREFRLPSALSGAASAAAAVVGGQGGLTAAEQGFMSSARRGDVAAVKAALSSGVQVDRLGDDALSALMRAAGWGRAAVVAALLEAGAKPDLMNSGKTALHHAAARGHPEVIRLLVAAKSNLNARPSASDDTPLLAAVKAGQPSAVRALIDGGADTSVADLFMTALEIAVDRADTAAVRELLKGARTPVNGRHPRATQSPLHGALWCKNSDYNVELIRTLLGAGADPSALDSNRDTPLAAVERKRAGEKLPYYQACYDAQVAVLKHARAR